MAGNPRRRARREAKRQREAYYADYVLDEGGLKRAYAEYAMTGVLEDPRTGERYCPSCERVEDYCDCGGGDPLF